MESGASSPAPSRPAFPQAAARWLKRWLGKPEKKFHLHLGVHKTATTYVQSALKLNSGALLEKGVQYWDLQHTRENLTTSVWELSRVKKDSTRARQWRKRIRSLLLNEETAKARRVVISDENLLGFVPGVFRKGGYFGVEKRFQPIRRMLEGDVKVYLTIRSYADFFSSIYCELITTKPFEPFDSARGNAAMMGFSWVTLYESLVTVFGRQNVVVFEFGSLKGNLDAMIFEMIGEPMALQMPAKQIRVSPSARAVSRIRREQENGNGLPLKDIVKLATRRYPKNGENRAFDPWTEEERQEFDRRYREDLDKIPCWKPDAKGGIS